MNEDFSISCYNDYEKSYYICPNCKRPIWMYNIAHDNDKNILCPFCKVVDSSDKFVIGKLFTPNEQYEWIIRLQFNASKSHNFNKAKSLAKGLPNFHFDNNRIVCGAKNIDELYKFYTLYEDLISIIKGWKNTQILLYDREYKFEIDFSSFKARAKYEAGKYSNLILDRIHLPAAITYEELPYPYVFYGNTFFAFARDIDDKLYFCSCEKRAIQGYIISREKNTHTFIGEKDYPLVGGAFPLKVAELSNKFRDNPIQTCEFVDGLCFKCNNKIPRLHYCLPMYGGSFMQHYGWWVSQEYHTISYLLEKGIDVSSTHYSPEFFDTINKLFLLSKEYSFPYPKDIEQQVKQYQKFIDDTIENQVRAEFGYKPIGEHWVSETILLNIVKGLYPNNDVLFHFRPQWLFGLEIDIFVPDLKLGFEYQGIQHFKAVKHWGGQSQLEKQREHDKRKAKICLEKGINLITVNYDEPLTTEYVKNKIKSNSEF